jgi:hypothetical protein
MKTDSKRNGITDDVHALCNRVKLSVEKECLKADVILLCVCYTLLLIQRMA